MKDGLVEWSEVIFDLHVQVIRPDEEVMKEPVASDIGNSPIGSSTDITC